MSSCKQRRRLSKSKRREIRRRQTPKTRRFRLANQQHVALLPAPIRSFFAFFCPCFTKPT